MSDQIWLDLKEEIETNLFIHRYGPCQGIIILLKQPEIQVLYNDLFLADPDSSIYISSNKRTLPKAQAALLQIDYGLTRITHALLPESKIPE